MPSPLQAGLVFLPLALSFVIAPRHSALRARRHGTRVLIESCAIQLAGAAFFAIVAAGSARLALVAAAALCALSIAACVMFSCGCGARPPESNSGRN